MKRTSPVCVLLGIAGAAATLAALSSLIMGMIRYQKNQRVKQRSKYAMQLIGNMLLSAAGENKQ